MAVRKLKRVEKTRWYVSRTEESYLLVLPGFYLGMTGAETEDVIDKAIYGDGLVGFRAHACNLHRSV